MKIITHNYIEEFRQLAGNSPILSKVVNFMEDYSSEINNLIYVDRDIEDAKWEKIGRDIAKNEGYNNGKNDGRIEGRLEGQLEEKQAMVENLLNFGDSVEKISAVSGLSVDEVLKIKESLE